MYNNILEDKILFFYWKELVVWIIMNRLRKLIDNEIITRVKDYSKNSNTLETYYNVGKLLIEAQGGEERAKYGDGLIKEYSNKLKVDLNYSIHNRILWRCRKFYLIFNKNMSTLSTQLSWSHYVELLSLNNIDEINYYIDVCINNNLSVRELRERIKIKEYERLDEEAKNKLINKKEISIGDYIKDPIVILDKYKYIWIM